MQTKIYDLGLSFSGKRAEELFLPAKSIFINYIVRIYRFEKGNPRSLVGIVEETGVKGKKAFTGYDELWEILNTGYGVKLHEKRGKEEE